MVRTLRFRPVALGMVVCVAYYLGCQVGMVLRIPPATTSVLWPPNAILTAVLLLTPSPRRWALYLLAAFPAHWLVEIGAGFPPWLVLTLFATNCCEALVGALAMRHLGAVPVRFNSLRAMLTFMGAVALLAPFVSCFPDAAVVTLLRGEPYWLVWRTRFFSNTLTALTMVPAIVVVAMNGRDWVRRSSWGRCAEAALLAAALLAVAASVFEGRGPLAVPGLSNPLPLLLGPMLWAAVRFGVGGTSLSLLATTGLALWSAVTGRGALAALAIDGVFAFQAMLGFVAVPLMCLASVVQQQEEVEDVLRDRLRFETLLSRLSGAFVHVPSHLMEQTFDTWLPQLGAFFGLERLALLLPAADGRLEAASSWTPAGKEPLGRGGASHDQLERLLGPARSGLEAGEDTDGAVRLVAGDRLLGVLVPWRTAAGAAWPPEQVQQFRIVADVMTSALGRKQTEDALRASEATKSAILSSLPASVVVLDRAGRIVAVNEAWLRFASARGAQRVTPVGVGHELSDVVRGIAETESAEAAELIAGVTGVLDGSRANFAIEYATGEPGRDRWYLLSAVPLRPGVGAVLSHADITERRRAELDAQSSRQELAHFLRVSTVGVLATSIAHELNQPLTAILANAQAARKLLEAGVPDLSEVRAALADVIEDDKRAGEVIRRMRELLRKKEPARVALDVNDLVRDVVSLIGNDAVIRDVAVRLELSQQPPRVQGERIQLQQVILNLMINAMEAVAGCAPDARTVVVRTAVTPERTVRVSVVDSGGGLGEGSPERAFTPFYTTKPRGMGMGLSITRSIVAAHHGHIWGENNPDRGATFHFTLPLTAD